MKKPYYCELPCPCGYYGASQKPCTCAHSTVTKPRKRFGVIYQKRISGPMLDRISSPVCGGSTSTHRPQCFLGIEVPRVDYDKLSGDRLGESSAAIRQRVQSARHIVRKSCKKPFHVQTISTSRKLKEIPIFGWGCPKRAAPLQFKVGVIQSWYEQTKKRACLQTVCDEPGEPAAAELRRTEWGLVFIAYNMQKLAS